MVPSDGEDVGKEEPKRITRGTVHWCGHFGDQFGSISEREKVHVLLSSNSIPR